jgi:predicted PurR-regulated permease PerM
MPTTLQTPFYKKFAYILIILLAVGYLLFIGQNIISPLLLAVLFAIMLRPMQNFLITKLRFPNALASILTVFVFVLFFAGIVYFISAQIAGMADDWDKIKSNVTLHGEHLQSYIAETFKLSKQEQAKMVNNARESMDSGSSYVSSTLLSFTDTLMNVILIPIYIFLILFYKSHFVQFLCKLFDKKHHAKLQDILSTIKVSIQSYIMGLLAEMIIVSTLTTVGLWIIGVKYALLLGIITGLLNLIPYVGILMAGVLTIFASLTGSSDLSIIVGIVIITAVVQFIDNNILVPMIVSSKVEINALASIVGIVIGGVLAGISGMFLAIPIMAILKVVFDRIDSLEPWGYLVGDDLPKTFEWAKIKSVVKKVTTPKK